ncbi:undecaprenyldiphospho-muramoylpentapeptide beta-N-acetylglucosaminyltransferase [Leucobacter sp. OLJS4]|uniref:undecaprenyldiphospho-muramoylpentapeptide beta-N-acetylglucosaminyltransferase n=1 Tax=unclassified Leucobacter TaxID=2621730 RepID=UPI000C19236A|nr:MULTISPECIES: undecaprenyldiphospho-muramoylpentapeptide beta-N-acetylglucosaminyltransferase [unclassified Leucobacter]PII81504.1 undecaprenyldiphospho-muramoylpentapeptide beta-N-acetylglucosaminyltransferase [Leucobacter sp. OLCALW19]PII86174.1 undecaprenyldiphospho-muramoylpentapeptide beta-N-acetylglucosaminyltransferase [Leucobacter sp. OLTLW20]PII90069.1 undecaprenyldiphospho-muramoylpentapeptide beta-N-acetylglucosaminyltransferase [Leucobacter sp. OLAS13]PII97102.1 undecaprenyldipho
MTRYLLAGGGTAGHVSPLLAVADRILERDPEASVLVLGTEEGLEARLVPQRGHELSTIPRVPFPRRPDLDAARFPARFRRAVALTREILRDRRIDLLIGFGGYVSAPAYVAARREHVPYAVHEANVRPGLANVWGARRAAAVGTAFPGTPLRGAEVVGMPLRAEIASLDREASRSEAAEVFGLDPHRPVLLVFGGSTGARRINDAFAGSWPAIAAAGWQLLHVTGEQKIGEVEASSADARTVVPYVDRMDLAYALADLVVCRSGAATVSEISALGIPAVYVPYAVGNGEQALNARSAVEAGGAVLIADADLTPHTVSERIVPLLHDADRRLRMSTAASVLGARDAAGRLLALAERTLG